jgi:hypothetical protein
MKTKEKMIGKIWKNMFLTLKKRVERKHRLRNSSKCGQTQHAQLHSPERSCAQIASAKLHIFTHLVTKMIRLRDAIFSHRSFRAC